MISVVIPTYNRPDYLSRLLESISTQTLLPSEVIVVDDASSCQDDYRKVIERFQSLIPQLCYYSLEINSGAPACRNFGILRAQNDWVALVDDDDQWLGDKLQLQVEVIHQASPQLGLIYTWTDVINQDGTIIPLYRALHRGRIQKHLLHECFIPSPSVVLKKQALLDAGLFDLKFKSCQDWDMWVRVVKMGYHVECVEKVCTLYHKHDRGSIGLSPRAKLGYLQFYRKHFWSLIRYGQCRHLFRYLKLSLKQILSND